jgi:uncharacterized repeat protein (TIGR01451 family)
MERKPFLSALLVLVIFLASMFGTIQAQENPDQPFNAPIVYEAVLVNDGETEMELLRLEADVPPGSAYVGLAVGSQVGQEAQRVGSHLIWEGSFALPPSGQLILRYWLAPTSPAPELPAMEIVGQTATETVVQAPAWPGEPISSPPPELEGPTSAEAVFVTKVAETPELHAGDEPWVAYQVTFTNNSVDPAPLNEISDALAPGFRFIGMAYGSDVADQPVDPDASTVVWPGPYAVPGNGDLTLRYWVQAVDTMGDYYNTVRATSGGVPVGPATATVTVRRSVLALDKGASPSALSGDGTVTYDVTMSNAGNDAGTLTVITDTLPSGFSFSQMDPASDVITDPVVQANKLIWNEAVDIPSTGEKHLTYRVLATGTGSKTNSVVARDIEGALFGPAESTVTISSGQIYLPLAFRSFRSVSPTLPMEEDFLTGVPPEWRPVLLPQYWRWAGDGVTWGRYDFSPSDPISQWALSLYLLEGAQDWTDYKIESTIRVGRHTGAALVGIWFRGTYDQATGDLGGYLFILRPREDLVHVGYIDPTAPGLVTRWPVGVSYVNNPDVWYYVTIEVRGANIKVWINGVQKINWTDPDNIWQRGTVGFTVYRGVGQFDDIRVTELP